MPGLDQRVRNEGYANLGFFAADETFFHANGGFDQAIEDSGYRNHKIEKQEGNHWDKWRRKIFLPPGKTPVTFGISNYGHRKDQPGAHLWIMASPRVLQQAIEFFRSIVPERLLHRTAQASARQPSQPDARVRGVSRRELSTETRVQIARKRWRETVAQVHLHQRILREWCAHRARTVIRKQPGGAGSKCERETAHAHAGTEERLAGSSHLQPTRIPGHPLLDHSGEGKWRAHVPEKPLSDIVSLAATPPSMVEDPWAPPKQGPARRVAEEPRPSKVLLGGRATPEVSQAWAIENLRMSGPTVDTAKPMWLLATAILQRGLAHGEHGNVDILRNGDHALVVV